MVFNYFIFIDHLVYASSHFAFVVRKSSFPSTFLRFKLLAGDVITKDRLTREKQIKAYLTAYFIYIWEISRE
jgi:hypothetical protein